jgi:hypothetical protein
MPEQQESTAINLMESNEFTTKVKCSLPGRGTDVRRPFEFDATFEMLPQDEYEDLAENNPKSEVVRATLRSVGPNVPGGTLPDGTIITPLEATIRNSITCDACFTAYWLYTSDDSRKAAFSAGDRKNFKRSRKR